MGFEPSPQPLPAWLPFIYRSSRNVCISPLPSICIAPLGVRVREAQGEAVHPQGFVAHSIPVSTRTASRALVKCLLLAWSENFEQCDEGREQLDAEWSYGHLTGMHHLDLPPSGPTFFDRYSMTFVACNRMDCGNFRPSILAVWR